MDVADDERPVVVDDVAIIGRYLVELLVVVSRALDGLLEDRRIRSEPTNAALADLDELARRDVATLQVVEPGTLSLLAVQLLDAIAHALLLGCSLVVPLTRSVEWTTT